MSSPTPNENDLDLAAEVATKLLQRSWLDLCADAFLLIEFAASLTNFDYQFLAEAGISTRE